MSEEQQQQRGSVAAENEAAYQQALAARDTAALNLARSEVRASVNGFVTNFDMRPGDYVDAGKPLFALIDSDSFYVDGYFEETKLPRIRVGDPARVYLVGEDAVIEGHVQYRGLDRGPGATGQRRSARQRESHLQLGAIGATSAGADRAWITCRPTCIWSAAARRPSSSWNLVRVRVRTAADRNSAGAGRSHREAAWTVRISGGIACSLRVE